MEDDHRGSFTSGLEGRARGATQDKHTERAPWSPQSSIDDQIRLTLHQIDENRVRGEVVRESMLLEKCEIGTELLQMEARTPRYSAYRFPQREKLQRRLGQLSAERRRFAISHAEKLDALHERLLGLVGKQRLLALNQ